jgi:hypothetical protein
VSKLRPLDPAVSVSCPPAELIAVEAGRSEKGIVATVQAYNGVLRHLRLVRLTVPKDCESFAKEAAEATGAAKELIEQKLIELAAAVEVRLRKPVSKKGQSSQCRGGEEPSGVTSQERFGEFSEWRSEDGLYLVRNGRTYRVSFNDDGDELLQSLANFAARVKEETVLDDGADISRFFSLEGMLYTGRALPLNRVPITRFAAMSWPAEIWGFGPSLSPGLSLKDHMRVAIEMFSGMDVARRTVFIHLGWRKVQDVGWVFLHAGGAAGGNGITVDIDSELQAYSLPGEPEDVAEAMKLSLSLLEVGDPRITFPLWAVIWRAPTCEWLPCLLVVWLLGESGTLKSSLAAVMLSHFGGPFDKDHLPASWLDTENRLEQKTFYAKDVPLVIDDFCPEKHPGGAQEMQRRASRLIRSAGNRQGRGRLRADLSIRKAYFPRGIAVATAEDLPNVAASALARILPVPFEKGVIDKTKLGGIQGQVHVLPYALRAYLDCLRSRADHLRDQLHARFLELRKKARVEGHDRLPEAVAHLHLGFEMGIAFALESEAMNEQEAEGLLRTAWDIFMDLAKEHAKVILDERPARRFILAIQEALAGGRGWLADRETGEVVAGVAGPGSQKLGWRDERGIYLIPGITYEFAAERLRNRNGLLITERSLRAMLETDGFLLRDSKDHFTSKPRCEGTPTWVLWVKPDALGDLPAPLRTCHACKAQLPGAGAAGCPWCGSSVCPECGACEEGCAKGERT